MNFKTPQILAPFLGLCVAQSAFSATIISNWEGAFSGVQAWGDGANWSTDPVFPNNGADVYVTTIANDTTGDLVVETPAAPSLNVATFSVNQTGTGSTTLKLGGNFTVTSTLSAFTNSNAASPDKVVIDLNGYEFSAMVTTNNNIRASRNYTIRDTSAGGDGIFRISSIQPASIVAPAQAGRVNVENNVTVAVYGVADMRGIDNSNTEGWNFSAGSTLQFAGEGYSGISYAGGTLGNVVVGSATNANQTRANLAGSATVLGDIVYHSSTGGNGSVLSLGNSAVLSVAGNFTDKNTTHGGYGYAASSTAPSPTLRFNGGLAQEREVWIAAPTTVRLQVGESETVFGNIKLKHDFTTTFTTKADGTTPTVNSGIFRLESGSRINLDTFTLTATTAQIISGTEIPTLAYTFGANSDALIHVTGTETNSLMLNSFRLELKYDGSGWNNGDNLLLFRYDGTTFSGTPTLTNLVAPNGFAYDSLTWGDIGGVNYVYLSNASIIPEPGTMVLVMLSAFVFPAIRRRPVRRL